VVSVVVLTYNHAPYLADALESIVAQDLDEAWEVIVADDASTDRTVEIAREFAARTTRIEVLTTPTNLGMQQNLRRAIEAARGTYVAFLEGDDFWTDPGKLRVQLEYLASHPRASAVGHLTEVVPAEGGATCASRQLFGRELADRTTVGLDDVLGGCFPHFSSLMYRAALLPTTPPWFDDLRAADWPICALLARQGVIGLLPGSMSVYRKNPDSTWAPRPQLERLLLLLDDRATFRARSGYAAPDERRQVAEANVRVASVGLRARQPTIVVRHALVALRQHPPTVVRWAVGAVTERARRIGSAHARRSEPKECRVRTRR
jgi:glycosyltransferase involved in cell wall biosynthesis